MTERYGSYTALCDCGTRRTVRKSDGLIGPHARGKGKDDCEGGQPISRTEKCSQCRVRVGEGTAHKMDCSNPRRTPTGMDTR